MTMLATFAPPARQTVIRAGLLADASSESVRILRRCHVDLGRLWVDLRRWHQSA